MGLLLRPLQVITTVRASPTNGTQPTAAAVATVPVTVAGCTPGAAPPPSTAQLLATGGALATASVTGAADGGAGREVRIASVDGTGGGSASGDAVISPNARPPLIVASIASVAPSAAFKWGVAATPSPPKLAMRYDSAAPAAFSVVYSRLPTGKIAVTGSVSLTNPNLIDTLPLARVQVELLRPGAARGAVVALAVCPRSADGLLFIGSQMAGPATLECGFALEADAAAAGAGAALTPVALLADGREALGAAVPLPGEVAAVPDGAAGPPPGECAVLCNRFVLLGDDGAKLLPKSGGGVDAGGGVGLAGEGCRGRAADVVCDGRTVTYSATFGPLGPTQCGTYTVRGWRRALLRVVSHSFARWRQPSSLQ